MLRRLIAKCLASKVKSKASELFDSLQLGVGISGGAEAILHSSKYTYDNIVTAQLDEGVLQIDFQNAFNSVKRTHLLKATYEFISGIAAFTNLCYFQHTPLYFSNAIIQVESVVQQVDLLGPLLLTHGFTQKVGLSPITVGEVLRRLIAKCLASKAKSKASELFDSLQLGVGISGGAEAILHSSKYTYDNIVTAQLDEGVLQIDFQNAFNSVKRTHLLKATYEFISGIAAFTNLCYFQHTPLYFSNAIIQVESVVQQVDLLGPLLLP